MSEKKKKKQKRRKLERKFERKGKIQQFKQSVTRIDLTKYVYFSREIKCILERVNQKKEKKNY